MSENTNKKIVLIDGHSILNRAFFGLRIDEFRRTSYECNLWISDDHVQDSG